MSKCREVRFRNCLCRSVFCCVLDRTPFRKVALLHSNKAAPDLVPTSERARHSASSAIVKVLFRPVSGGLELMRRVGLCELS
jgi:hypothetical protein